MSNVTKVTNMRRLMGQTGLCLIYKWPLGVKNVLDFTSKVRRLR